MKIQAVLSAALSAVWPARFLALVKSFGPYAAIVLLVPGGSFIALALLAYRQHSHRAVRS